jgi:predicted amidohydrolase YtcJ
VLDRDIFTIPAVEVDQVQVCETYIQGERVFQRA